jgi:hypothetical protein
MKQQTLSHLLQQNPPSLPDTSQCWTKRIDRLNPVHGVAGAVVRKVWHCGGEADILIESRLPAYSAIGHFCSQVCSAVSVAYSCLFFFMRKLS